MNLLANSIRDRGASIPSRNGLDAPTPGRPSSGRRIAAYLLAVVWSLFPAVLGFALANLFADRPVTALLSIAGHQAAAWFLTFYTGGPARPGRGQWVCVLLGGGLTIGICAPAVLPWLLLPVLPALLLRSACRHGPMPSARTLMRIFSVAALAAALMQLAGSRPEAGVVIAVVGAVLLCLLALEKLVTASESESGIDRGARPDGA